MVRALRSAKSATDGKKTFAVSFLTVAYALIAFYLGEIDANRMIDLIITSGLASTFRDALNKLGI